MNVQHPHRHRPKRPESVSVHRPALVLERNIEALLNIRREDERARRPQDRAADAITAFTGSMAFVYLHVAWFVAWILINTGITPVRPFDPFPFGLLTMVVSLEAIFLSTFVLITQNRMAEVADKRADLDLQINLLAEREATRILTLVDAIADHLGLEAGKDPEIDDLKAITTPEDVLDQIRAVKAKRE